MTNSSPGLEDLGELHDASIWKAANIRPSIRATGIAAFAFRIRSLLPGWAYQWTRLLDQMDRVLSDDVSGFSCTLFLFSFLFSDDTHGTARQRPLAREKTRNHARR